MDAPEIVISPYVTSRGGVVILNGPFPIDQAKQVAALCKAAPYLLEACRDLLGMITDNRTHGPEIDKACVAIAKARPA